MITRFFRAIQTWFLRLFARKPRLRGVVFFESDELPSELPVFDLAVAREGDTLWSAGLVCPCGCGRRLEVMLLSGVKPRWDLSIDSAGLPSLHPSVWVNDGCRAHFFLRNGQIIWC